ncbi:MAG: EAL domain-containing protein [Peptococcaceae bacterium]|nr:EAL domain-containing protein [Peptococcaceae bacterium]
MRQYPTLRQLSIGFTSLFMLLLFIIVFVSISRAFIHVVDKREETSSLIWLTQIASHMQDNLETVSAVTRNSAQAMTARLATGMPISPGAPLTPDILVGLDFALLMDPAGNITDAWSFDREHHMFMPMQPEMAARLQDAASHAIGQPGLYAGFFETAGNTYAAASYPVFDPAVFDPPESSTPYAILMYGQNMGHILAQAPQNTTIQNIPPSSALSRLPVSALPATPPGGAKDTAGTARLSSARDQISVDLPPFISTQRLTLVYRLPLIQPAEAVQSLSLPLLVLSLLCLAIIGLIAVVVEKFMYKPLQSLAVQVAAVDINKAHTPIFNRYRNHELNFLAGAIQDMLNRIAVNQETIQTTNAWLQIYSKAVHTTADDFLIMSPDGVVQFMNPAAMRNMSAIDDQLLGKDIWSYIENSELSAQIMETVFDRRTWRGEIIFRPKDEPDPRFIIEEATFSPVLNDDGAYEYITLIKHSIQVKKHYENLIQRLAHYNALTQLPNRLWLRSQLEDLIAAEPRRSITVFMLSVNNFKFVNDTLGHTVGDQLLKHIAEKLQDSFPDATCVANTHGDIFALTFVHMNDNEAISQLAHKRLLTLFEHPFMINKREYVVSVAVGASVYPVDGVKADAILQCAETAMYAAKSSKHSVFLRFDIAFFQAIEKRLTMERELRQALGQKEFIVYYQPKVDISSYKIVGSEALIRWKNKGELILPDQFIPLAEETGLIVPITWFVLEEACRQTMIWHKLGFSHLSVAVNISPQTLLEPGFSDRVDAILADTGLPAKFLKLEITEESLLDDRLTNNTLLKSLRAKDIQISIDDFGTGYSSLLYLKELSLDEIKLDRIFISGIPDNPEDMVIVQATTSMARALGMRAVAEGVETKEQLEALTHLYCNEFQGFYYSAPVPEDAFHALLREKREFGVPGRAGEDEPDYPSLAST